MTSLSKNGANIAQLDFDNNSIYWSFGRIKDAPFLVKRGNQFESLTYGQCCEQFQGSFKCDVVAELYLSNQVDVVDAPLNLKCKIKRIYPTGYSPESHGYERPHIELANAVREPFTDHRLQQFNDNSFNDMFGASFQALLDSAGLGLAFKFVECLNTGRSRRSWK